MVDYAPMFSPITKQLIESLRWLPGIGQKSAQRMAFKLLNPAHHENGRRLLQAIELALTQIKQCQNCRMYTEHQLCELCSNPRRNNNQLCVAESPADVIAIEQSACYSGRYFVLYGHLSPLDGLGPTEIGIPQLLQQLKQQQYQEVILATNSTMEGEATAHYIATELQKYKIRCSRLAHGVPIGGELEYLDGHTLAHALQSRISLKSEEVA